ncbi:MAG: hypothetical protein IH897_07360 [Planctomycetes bacterium]|nr:hypothetical protein [Planctomycetota bacterium]
MTEIVFKTAVLLIASAAAVGAETRPSTEDASKVERKTDSPTERSITFHVLGLMKTKSGAT